MRLHFSLVRAEEKKEQLLHRGCFAAPWKLGLVTKKRSCCSIGAALLLRGSWGWLQSNGAAVHGEAAAKENEKITRGDGEGRRRRGRR